MSLEAQIEAKFSGFNLSVTLTLPAVGYTVMLGPSGSGKSLTLKALAGLQPTKARIFLDGKEISCQPPEKRKIVYLPQSHALFPHLSVYENLLFPFKAQGRAIEHDLVEEVVETFALRPLLSRSPRTLSGGEAQRVALARAVCACPRVLLLDEPLSSLDFHLKFELLSFLKNLPSRFSLSVLHVTHDPLEALFLAEQVYLLRKGEVIFSGEIGLLRHLLKTKEKGGLEEVFRRFVSFLKGQNLPEIWDGDI